MKVRALAVVGVLVCAVQLVRAQAAPADATSGQDGARTSQVQQHSRP